MTEAAKTPAPADVWSLMVTVGRAPDDGLPEEATGAGLFCFSAGKDEKNAVDEAVRVLRLAGMAPLEVDSYGSRTDREAEGHDIPAEDLALMDRARDENAVIVVSVTTFDD